MRLIAHAKINWTLSVLSQREDGYHVLEMLMQSIGLSDTLEITEDAGLAFSIVGRAPVPSGADNLVMRAAEAIRGYAGVRRGAHIRLKKRIPVGAGLGGGSADAAATLLGLDRLWGLNLRAEELEGIALSLGADVPFCLTGGLAHAQGVGERLTHLPLPPPVDLVVIKPTAGLSTPTVFRTYDALQTKPVNPDTQKAARALSVGDLPGLASSMGNALTPAAASIRPEIIDCIQALEHYGALRAQMTGSGSAVIGLFSSPDAAARAEQACGRFWRSVRTRTAPCGVSILSL